MPCISVSPFAACPSDARDKRVQRVAHACDTHVAAQAGPGPPGASGRPRPHAAAIFPLFILNRAHRFPRIRICSQSSGAKRRTPFCKQLAGARAQAQERPPLLSSRAPRRRLPSSAPSQGPESPGCLSACPRRGAQTPAAHSAAGAVGWGLPASSPGCGGSRPGTPDSPVPTLPAFPLLHVPSPPVLSLPAISPLEKVPQRSQEVTFISLQEAYHTATGWEPL